MTSAPGTPLPGVPAAGNSPVSVSRGEPAMAEAITIDPVPVPSVTEAEAELAEPVPPPDTDDLTSRQLLRSPTVVPGSGRLPSAEVDLAVLVPVLQAAYGLGAWQHWHRAPRGKSNVTYFVDTQAAGRVVLRRSHRQKTVAGARFEAALLDHLVAAGYPAPAVLRTSDGAVIVEIDGVVHMAFRLLPGGEYDPYNLEHLREAARGLARFHRATSSMPLLDVPRASSALSSLGFAGLHRLEAVRPLCDRALDAAGRKHLATAIALLGDELTLLETELGEGREELSMGLLHASYGRSALLFVGDRLSGVVDYDRTVYDLLTLDLAYSLKAFCREGAASGGSRVGMDPPRCRAFLQAYSEVTSLPGPDIDALPLVFRAQRLIKVIKKCDNLLTKQAVVEQQSKDVSKLVAVLDKEIARLAWLGEHSTELADALAA